MIKQLRATGAKLPVEMFIATESDYEKEFCEKVLQNIMQDVMCLITN